MVVVAIVAGGIVAVSLFAIAQLADSDSDSSSSATAATSTTTSASASLTGGDTSGGESSPATPSSPANVLGTAAPTDGVSPQLANPDASTISAIVIAAIAALGSLATAFLSIKVASDQSNKSNETARQALKVAAQVNFNSTTNGSPILTDLE